MPDHSRNRRKNTRCRNWQHRAARSARSARAELSEFRGMEGRERGQTEDDKQHTQPKIIDQRRHAMSRCPDCTQLTHRLIEMAVTGIKPGGNHYTGTNKTAV